MTAFLAGLAGVVIGGVLSLVGVFWTLRRQAERDRKNDERHLRDRKHDRLRQAYRDVVAAAYHLPHHASVLGLTYQVARTQGTREQFYEALRTPVPDTSEARAILFLEADQDRAVLDKLTAISINHLAFLAWMAGYITESQGAPSDEYVERCSQMQAEADELAALARERLAEFEKPLGP